MQVLASDEGELCALSPNQGMCALVKNGLVVVFINYVQYTTETQRSDAPSSSSCGEAFDAVEDPYLDNINERTPPPPPPACRRRDAVISTHTALDEIHELHWSPDSTLVALLLARRKIVEIVSVYGKCCVARIDAGISGLRAVRWHPSSRVVYWVGLLQAHAISLVDSQVMRLAGGVKYSYQLESKQQPLSHVDMPGDTTATATTTTTSSSTQSSFSRASRHPVSEAALIRFSICRRFLLYVAPKSLHSPLSTNREGQKDKMNNGATTSLGLNNNNNKNVDDTSKNTRPQRSEWFVVSSATTHEELFTFPTLQFVQNVSDFIPLDGGVVLVDYIHGSMALISYNGAQTLYCEPSGVEQVVASKNGTVLLICFSNACRFLLVSPKRVLPLRRITFEEDVILSLKLQELQLLKEPTVMERFPVGLSCLSGVSYRKNVDILMELEKSHECMMMQAGRVRKSSYPQGHAAISASGEIAAVTLEKWPLWVLIIDIFSQRVTEVLLHKEPVIGFCWSPSPTSEYWRFQRCHFMDKFGENEKMLQSGNSSRVSEKTVPGQEEPLLVMTNNDETKIFLWLAKYAMCFMASREDFMDGAKVKQKQKSQSGGGENMWGSKLQAFRFNRGMFGESAANAVLVDDLRGAALTVKFRMNTSNP